MAKPILISEIFGPTIQGEGSLIGKPTVFVRTGSCDFRCNWCDTLFAVLPEHKDEWTPMQPDEIVARVLLLTSGAPILVTISGGNPALHDLSSLLEIGHQNGLTFAMETQGSIAREWFGELDYLVLSPKGPSSGMRFENEKLRVCLESAGNKTQTLLKIVVFDEEDYVFARNVSTLFPNVPMVLQAGSSAPVNAEKIREGVDWLLQRAAQDGWFDVTILPQLHVLLWGSKRGV
jgi:7-carboxy-7-deazaguanine synthase